MVNQMFRRSEKIDYKWYKVALLEHPVNPFSFLRTVFFYKQDYLENRIAANVLKHELEHVRQAHSFDVIYFELLHMVFWFNPVLLFYKQAARINHEYLADEAVISSFSDRRTYGNELINFISRRVSVPFTCGFNPSMIRLRLLMLNTSTSKHARNLRMMVALLFSFLVITPLTIRPAFSETSDPETMAGKKDKQEDIIINNVYFKGPDFKQLKSLIAMNGKILQVSDIFSVDPQQIKTIDILIGRKAKRKYGKEGMDGVVEIFTYGSSSHSAVDTLKWKSRYTVNQKVPNGTISVPVSKLYSLSIWNYPVFPNQDLHKRWRTIEIMTRDYYKIAGTVLKSDGEALKDVHVSATDNPSQVITDSDGRFVITDVNPGSMIELSADGYSPYSFKVSDKLFDNRLAITMSRINEPDPDMVIMKARNVVRDFSGTWKLNKELTKLGFPGGYNRVCEILQYDSDSINIKDKVTSPDIPEKKDYSSEDMLIFNKIKAHESEDKIRKFLSSCVISPDGQSFSIIFKSKSIIESYRNGFSQITTYSMSDDGKQLFIGVKTKTDRSSDAEVEHPPMVFDKIGDL
jgi:hypothetical protein